MLPASLLRAARQIEKRAFMTTKRHDKSKSKNRNPTRRSAKNKQPETDLVQTTAESGVVSQLGELPRHPTTQSARQKAVLQLQRRYGNAYVARMLDRPVQPEMNEALSGLSHKVAKPNLVQRDNGETTTTGKSHYDAIQDFVEDSAEEWRLNKDHFDLALRNFHRRMRMASEDEAVPDVTGALVKHVVDNIMKTALGKVETLIPGWAEVKGALDAMTAELARADTARKEVSLRDFMMTTDRIMSKGFEEQIRAVRKGRKGLKKTVDDWSDNPDIQQNIVDSFPNWLKAIKREVPSADQYEAELYVEWVNRHYGQLEGYTTLGRIELKYNAEDRGKYEFESAKVMTPFPKKVASGLNWIMATPSLGMNNVLKLPIRKVVGLYAENIVGGTGYGWAQMDEKNNTIQLPVQPVAKKRWHEMPWAPLEAVKKVSG